MTQAQKTHHLAVAALLAAVAAVLQFIEFSIPIMPAFIKLDISDLPALLGTFSLGPVYGVAIQLVKNYFIVYPAYVVLYGLPLEAIVGMYQEILGTVAQVPTSNALLNCLLVFNVPFTLCKGLLDVALCFLIYKPLSPLLHK